MSVIFSRAPLRISLGGGGTDLRSYYQDHGGFLVAGAIDKYVYILTHTVFQRRYLMKYAETEVVDEPAEIRHPILRESLLRHWRGNPIEIASVADVPAFWSALADFFDVTFHDRAQEVLPEEVMPGARWFPGATLNYAEHALRDGEGKGDEDLAVIFVREDGLSEEISYGELRNRVAAARSAFAELGVGAGDRVAALAPNSPETLVAFLAAASLGATWSSCSPDFGVRAVADRFVQIEPKVLIAVDGYCYGGRRFDVRETVDQLRAEMPDLAATVLIDSLGEERGLSGALDWSELLAHHRGAPLEFTAVPFDHPLWILYSSGTTGLPKGIVHGHGGMVLEHLKAVGLHCDLGPGDRFFWFTTTGWMMWNFLVGGLLTGTTLVLFDGSPGYPSLSSLWELAARYRSTYGTRSPLASTKRCSAAGTSARSSTGPSPTTSSTMDSRCSWPVTSTPARRWVTSGRSPARCRPRCARAAHRTLRPGPPAGRGCGGWTGRSPRRRCACTGTGSATRPACPTTTRRTWSSRWVAGREPPPGRYAASHHLGARGARIRHCPGPAA